MGEGKNAHPPPSSTTWLWKRKRIEIISKRKNKWNIKRLKEEVKNNEDELLKDVGESKIYKLLTDLKHENMTHCMILQY